MKPLLAAKATLADIDHLNYPVLVSPKLDGIRCLIVNGQAVTRTLKPIPNKYIREELSHPSLSGLDGELVLPGKSFSETTSAVMSREGQPGFKYFIFDDHTPDLPFSKRVEYLPIIATRNSFLSAVPLYKVESAKSLLHMEENFVSDGYEGIMIRDPDGRYKHGRSTLKEGILLKLKRFEDSEAVVSGYVERMHNGNESTVNALGMTERSMHKANKRGMDTLGALLVDHPVFGRLEVGTGFDDATRAEIWSFRKSYYGRMVKFKYQPSGMKDKPRFPVFVGFRSKSDL